MTQYDADVVIAGAGMAGATFALAAVHAGLKPILVDPLPFESQLAETFDGRASAIAYSSFRQWRVLGVAERLAEHAERMDHILVTDGHTPGAARGQVGASFLRFDAEEIADRAEGEPLGYMIENRRIRAGLAETVREAGIEVLAPAAVVGVEVDQRCATVRLKDGRTLTAPLVVGAEGRVSPVREAAGINCIGWEYRQGGVVATVRMDRPHGGVAHEYFLPSGPFAILPLTENRASLVWTEPKARAEALRHASPEAFDAHLRRRFGDFLGGVTVEGPRFVYPLTLSLAERMTAPRIALLGDSAHGVHPIAGQGLNLGLKDAAALAEVLVDALRIGEDLGSEAVLERYARWRRFDNVMLAAATDVFNRMFSNDFPLVRAARGVGMAVVNRIGPARRFFMTEAGGAVGDLPKLLRGQGL
ncbi:UbiH/UbiF/VisC/COQ6 family ubiquinone biosynthesis hydroxylase [Caulobacter sp. 17J65-9]|uniref:UbiH/UbiF/VisC/COQ6 family ubiquinone biosynthesis hydroxylase n=1 Tax=Caulobacter sp. 17J65-9 TaxID=2709382 RepID=UPI0013CB84CB|nr:UbiH/UbiF/VisC/COQ6 family ubiquinone biosynthesis hydroxylase [Caulobacter sp. 17J65-9]NEX95283.1 UbiH/UbiF/VisC/COQ6 family ubiquinone biosynthesis hydroxylase [Caulobacter sp. 17J65-9]